MGSWNLDASQLQYAVMMSVLKHVTAIMSSTISVMVSRMYSTISSVMVCMGNYTFVVGFGGKTNVVRGPG